MRDIIIYGCGGFGREVLQVIHALNAKEKYWNCLGFAVDPGVVHPEKVHELPVAEHLDNLRRGDQLDVVIAIGSPAVRRRIADKLEAASVSFPSLVHPKAWVGENVALFDGVLICANACLTTDIRLAPHVHVNLSATIGHDAVIGAFSTISPGANISGNVRLGEAVDIGTGVTVIQGVEIGANAVVGAGAAVVRSIPAGCTAVGVPAKVIKFGADQN